MTLNQLFEAAGLDPACGSPEEVRGVVCDSRQAAEGTVFVAIAGAKQDGAEFAEDACRRGAIAVVGEQRPEGIGAAVFVGVDDARLALARLSCAWFGDPSRGLSVAAVTGTNGK